MRSAFNLKIILRILAPLLLAPLLGLGARPHSLERDLHLAGSAMQASARPEKHMAASRSLARLAAQNPWRTDLWEPAGRQALLGGDAQAATRHLQRAAAAGSLSAQGRLALGQARLQTGDLAGAILIWEDLSRSASPPADVFPLLLQAHRLARDYPGAVADLQTMTALHPSDGALRYQLGLLLAVQQPEAALAHLAQAAELDPRFKDSSDALIGAIRTASLQGDAASILVETGRALAAQGEWELAAEALRSALDARPNDANAWAFLGEALQRQNPQDPQALAALQRSIELDPNSLAANSLLALYWQRQGDFEKALTHLQHAAQLYPQNPALQADLGSLQALMGDLEAALQAHQQAVALAPTDPAYYRLLAEFCIRHEFQLRQVGLPAARNAVLLAPRQPSGLDVLAQVLLLLKDLDSAERFLQQAVEIQPDYPPAHLHLGLVYILQGNQQRARQAWELAIQLAPESPTADQAARLMQNYFP